MVKNILKSFMPKLIGLRLMTLYQVKPKSAIYKAFLLFSKPRAGYVKPHQKDYLKAHQAEKIKFKKILLQTYRWPGKGPKVLLLHGWDSHSYRWKGLVEQLRILDYDIIAFDAPAHGYSEGNILNVPIYNEALELMINLHQPDYLIGHSVGGMTCIYNQYKNANTNIKKMVLLGSPSEMHRIIYGLKKILGLSNKFIEATENYFDSRYGYTFKDFSMARFAKQVKTPSLIIHDKYDKIVPYKEAQSIGSSLKNSRILITEGAGHSLNKDSINYEITKFIQD